MRVRIHREGINIILALVLILVVVCATAYLFVPSFIASAILWAISAVILCLVINFFRSPARVFKGDKEGIVVSSADGTVVALEEVETISREDRDNATLLDKNGYAVLVLQRIDPKEN